MRKWFEPVAFFLIWVFLFLVGKFVFATQHGWDAQVYCEAANIDAVGQNPYLSSRQLPFGLPWLYPPLLLNLFRLLCAAPLHFSESYPFFFLLILLSSVLIWRPSHNLLLALTLAAGGFAGLAWSLWTGNFELILILPVSLAFHSMERQRWSMAAFWLGITASLKLLHLAYLLPLLWAPISWKDKIKAVGVGLGIFLLLWSGLTWSRPDLAPTYLGLISGMLDQMVVRDEFGSIYHPAFPFVWAALLGWPNDAQGLMVGVILGIALAALVFLLVWRLVIPRLPISQQPLFLIVVVFFLVTFFLPRFKPYSFVVLLPFFFFLLRRQSISGRVIALTIAVLPSLALLLYHLSGVKAFWVVYSQPLAVCLALSICLMLEWKGG